MSSNIAKTEEENPIVKKITDKLRKEIADLIPEEYLVDLVQKEVKRVETKEIPEIIKSEVKVLVEEKVKKLVSDYMKEYCGSNWTEEQRKKMKPELDKAVESNMLNIFQNAMIAPIRAAMQLASGEPIGCKNCHSNDMTGSYCNSCGQYSS